MWKDCPSSRIVLVDDDYMSRFGVLQTLRAKNTEALNVYCEKLEGIEAECSRIILDLAESDDAVAEQLCEALENLKTIAAEMRTRLAKLAGAQTAMWMNH